MLLFYNLCFPDRHTHTHTDTKTYTDKHIYTQTHYVCLSHTHTYLDKLQGENEQSVSQTSTFLSHNEQDFIAYGCFSLY